MRETIWLEVATEDGICTTVNMDFIQSFSVSKYLNGKYKVYLFPHGDDDPFVAFTGSEERCQAFLKDLNKKLGTVKIEAILEHRCQCVCGCEAMIREDFELCDECSGIDHLADYFENLDDLKKDAVRIAGNDPDGFTR